MKKRKIMAMALSCLMVLSAVGCGNDSQGGNASGSATNTNASAGGGTTSQGSTQAEGAEITLWTYPIGKWGDAATVDGLIASFNAAHPEIKVTVEYLDYSNGDDQINTAIEGNQAPDIVLEGPERLVANWGARGLMVDLADLWTDEAKGAIYASVESACKGNDGVYYEYPLCMTAHTMAINRDIFEAAGAMQYIDEASGTWTTDNFIKAVKAVYDSGQANVGAVYCNGQGGDQGTRALVNNLYGGTFTLSLIHI